MSGPPTTAASRALVRVAVLAIALVGLVAAPAAGQSVPVDPPLPDEPFFLEDCEGEEFRITVPEQPADGVGPVVGVNEDGRPVLFFTGGGTIRVFSGDRLVEEESFTLDRSPNFPDDLLTTCDVSLDQTFTGGDVTLRFVYDATFRVYIGETDPLPLPSVVKPNLSPILECVVDNGDGTLTARFGYENREPYDFTIPVGSNNRLVGPQQSTDGPVTDFSRPFVVPDRPGRTAFDEGAFTVTFADDATVVWKLVSRTATASADSKRCASGR